MKKPKLPEKLTDDNVLDPEFFREDLENMYESIGEMDEFTRQIDKDLKEKYFNSENRNLYGRGTLTFSSKQMEILASLYTGKNNALNQAIRTKIDISKLSLTKKKSDEAGIDTELMAREFQKLFMQNKNQMFNQNEQFETIATAAQNSPIDNEQLDSRISKLIKTGEMKLTDNEQAIRYEKRDVQIRVQNTPQPHFVAIAGDTGEILPEYPPTLLPKNSILTNAVFDNGMWRCGNGKDFYSL